MITASDTAGPAVGPDTDPVLWARGLVKRYGNVTAIRGSDFELFPAKCWRSSATTAPENPASSRP